MNQFKMQCEKHCLTGCILTVSHTFKIGEYPIFFLELLEEKELVTIIIRKSNQLAWQPKLQPGMIIKITNLVNNTLNINGYHCNVLVTGAASSLTISSKEDGIKINRECHSKVSKLNSYKGVVTSCEDPFSGLFTVNHNACLITSYMLGITGELWTDKETRKSSIQVGDELTIYNCHFVKEDGHLVVICCGKTRILTKRNIEQVFTKESAIHPVVHLAHSYNFHYVILRQLFRLYNDIQLKFEDQIHREKLCIKSAMVSIMKIFENSSKIQVSNRSLVEEFVRTNHSCVPMKHQHQLPEFTYVSDILNESTEDEEAMFTVCQKEIDSPILGILTVGDDGYICLCEKRLMLPLLLPNTSTLYEYNERLVLIHKSRLIEEKFSLFGAGKINKKYLFVDSSNVVPIGPVKLSEDQHIEMKILAKGGLNFGLHKTKDVHFICKSHIFTIKNGVKVSIKKGLLKFPSSFFETFSFIDDRCTIYGTLQANDLLFTKTKASTSLSKFADYFGTTECTDVPSGFKINRIESNTQSAGVTLLSEVTCASEFITIEGFILRRAMMNSKYSSERDAKSYIGFPDNKIIRVYIRDRREDVQMWLYLVPGTSSTRYQYPLGFIPGALVSISFLQYKQSQNGRYYLINTALSLIKVLSIETLDKVVSKLPQIRRYICEVTSCDSSLTFLIIGTICYINHLELFLKCGACDTELINGNCDYVGCHYQGTGIISGTARVTVDDGTGTVKLYLQDAVSMQNMLQFTSSQWQELSDLLRTHSKVTYVSKSSDPFSKYCDSKVLRPVKATCRKFAKKSNLTMQLFCLSMMSLTPMEDLALLQNLDEIGT